MNNMKDINQKIKVILRINQCQVHNFYTDYKAGRVSVPHENKIE